MGGTCGGGRPRSDLCLPVRLCIHDSSLLEGSRLLDKLGQGRYTFLRAQECCEVEVERHGSEDVAEAVVERTVFYDVYAGLWLESAWALGGFGWDEALVVVAYEGVVCAALSYEAEGTSF